jgi:putative ABC transport system substrate-binding protein
MNERKLGSFALSVMLLALSVNVDAQQAKKMARVGFLSGLSGLSPTFVAFKERLGELGWVEGKQIQFEYRYREGNFDKVFEFATELVRSKVDVIVAGPGNR